MKALILALLAAAALIGAGAVWHWQSAPKAQDPLVRQLRQEADQLRTLTETWRVQINKGK
ncbi:MAG: hypothetical protein KJ558_07970 [Gammaproteobacteria bacterium]|nr:hypothetical protein [Gammaproteobacteria bacterium]MBU1654750.1 hypothetical protein [Gammaproteobacteria bacterium]MBU1961625.1 hypothetical protein [Gammaproteobacteria bacterium]